MTRNRTTVSRALAVGLLAAIAGSAHAQTEVPRGGAVITPGAGSGQIVIEVKNKTGKDAYDISVSVYRDDGGAVPNITGQDIVQNDGQAEDDDHVDDNGNGKLDNGEGNSTDDSPGTTCKSIMDDNGAVKDGKVAKVTVDFDGPLPEGAKIRVKFSERIGDKHYDLCMAFPPSDDGVALALCDIGPAQMSYNYLNPGPGVVDVIALPIQPGPVPILDVRLAPPYESWPVFVEGNVFRIYDLGLVPGQSLDLGLEFVKPIEFPWEQCQFPIIGIGGNCRADVNEDGVVDTRDFLEFLNLYNLRDPFADWNGDGLINTLDFLAFQNDWSRCR